MQVLGRNPDILFCFVKFILFAVISILADCNHGKERTTFGGPVTTATFENGTSVPIN